MEEYVVYVLYSEKFGKYYTGFTSDLIQRLNSHNYFATKGYTVKFRPWTVVYIEFFRAKKEALSREKYLKSGQGRSYLNKILK